jgi:N-acylneuraminate-9-phosphatase
MGINVAEACTAEYLKAFRKCPDNGNGLERYRRNLWRDYLPDGFKHLHHEIYELWLKYRYKYLAMPEELLSFLRRLRKNYLIGLITNGPSEAQWEKIHMLKLTNMFDCIVVSSDTEWQKPDPRIFQCVCNYFNVTPINCVMVGDTLNTDILVSSY